jgi:hypothetical protein
MTNLRKSMRITYTILGVLFMMTAAVIFALGPIVEFAPLSVERCVIIATPTLALLRLALLIMAPIPPRRKEVAGRTT